MVTLQPATFVTRGTHPACRSWGRHLVCRSIISLVLLSLLLLTPCYSSAADWTYWRGPAYDGISHETGLIDDWDAKGGAGSNVAWQRNDLGGRSTPIVMDGRLYTIVRAEPGTSREGEKVVCVDAETGKTIWENRFNVYLSDVPAERLGWSSCVGDPATGRIYALGVCGLFQCIDGKTGKRIWSVPLHEKFGLLSTYGGRTNFPVICDDLVIISAIVIGWGEQAKPCHRFLGMNKTDGTIVWFNGTRPLPYDTNYSAPTITTLAGQKALVVGSGDGAVWAMQPRTGVPLWQYRFSRRGLNVAPLVVGDEVFASHSEENVFGTTMGAAVGIDATGKGDITDTGELWKIEEMMAGKSSPIAIDGRLYLADDRAKLFVLDMETGDQIGDKINLGSSMRSSLFAADGKIYAFTAGGRWYILEPDEDEGAIELSSGRLLRGDECHASPIAANGRLYMQTSGRMYCLVDPDKTPGTTEAQAPPPETAYTDKKPAHLQIVPCEMLLKPGQSQKLTTRLFNTLGQLIGETTATFSIDGQGTVSGDGEFTSPADATHGASIITASAEGLTGHARIRIIPPLPWKFDFEDTAISPVTKSGAPPVQWVGVRYRHIVREVDGNKVMVKITTIPKGARSRGWLGHPELHDYTIQADVKGQEKGGKLPDIGLTAQGYAIDLQGARQGLQIRSWVTQLRMAQTVDYPWKPDTWYTLKLRVETQDAGSDAAKVKLFGKVWPRDESEPTEWTVTATDDTPNVTGSPGLFGNAKDAEIYLDNILVTPN